MTLYAVLAWLIILGLVIGVWDWDLEWWEMAILAGLLFAAPATLPLLIGVWWADQ